MQVTITRLSDRPTGEQDWELYIDPALAPNLSDAFEIPGDPESNLLGMYGETYWESWGDAMNALCEWYRA